jgi:hypothetical protein
MTQRTASPTNFTQIQVCEYALSSANPPTSLAIDSLTLPPPTQQADQILVIGDTGCREKGSTQQNCNGNPAHGAWDADLYELGGSATKQTFTIPK